MTSTFLIPHFSKKSDRQHDIAHFFSWFSNDQPIQLTRKLTTRVYINAQDQIDKCVDSAQCALTFCSSGISKIGISISSSKEVVTTSCQVHQCLKRFSVAHFTFIWIATLAGLSGILAINLYRNHPGSSNN